MSVIVRQLANTYMEVFVKGAPEVMMDICTPESSKLIHDIKYLVFLDTYDSFALPFYIYIVPKDYQEQLYWYTHRGYRVIACASRRLHGVKWHKLHKLKR